MVKLRSIIPLLVLYLFPFVVVALMVGLFALALTAAAESLQMGRLAIQLLVVPVVVGIIAAIRDVLAVRPRPMAGPEFLRGVHPALWAEVDDLAKRAQTAPPERIVLVAEVNAAVTEVAGQREMIVGLPLLASLTVAQLRAVLAHELGHFAGGDTAAAARTLRARRFVIAARDNAGWLTRWFFSLYYRVLVLASSASSRDVELRADQISAAAAGPRAAASALRRVAETDRAWAFVVEERIPLFAPAEARAPLSEAVTTTLAVHQDLIARDVDEEFLAEKPRWDDSHPLTSARIAALTALDDPGVVDDERPATALVSGGAAALTQMEGQLLTQDWPVATWESVTSAALGRLMPQHMGQLILALHEEHLIEDQTPRSLLDALATNPQPIGERLSGGSMEPAAVMEGIRLAADAVAQGTLAQTPGIRIALDAQAEGVLVDPTGSLIPVRDLAEHPRVLAQRLTAYGADLDRWVDAASVPEPGGASVVLGALTMLKVQERENHLYDLLVCSDGLLFVRSTLTAMNIFWGAASVPRQVRRVRHLVETLPEVRAAAGNEWIPDRQIQQANWPTIPARITLTQTDGTVLTLSFHSGFKQIPVLVESPLHTLLGDRLSRKKPKPATAAR